ncbi:hypothetical protein ACFLTY_05135 [Chloroflexota bacterium]
MTGGGNCATVTNAELKRFTGHGEVLRNVRVVSDWLVPHEA